MRALCVCNGGHVRSVTLARLLNKRGLEALACGVDDNYSDATIAMMFGWADVVYIQADSLEKLNKRFDPNLWKYKISTALDVGPDDWKVPQHPHLVEIMRRKVQWHESMGLFPPRPEVVPA